MMHINIHKAKYLIYFILITHNHIYNINQGSGHNLLPLDTLEIIAGDIFKYLAISDYLYPSSIAVIILLFLYGKS